MSQWSCDIFQGQTLTLIIWNKGTDSFIQLINMNPLLQKRSINQQLLRGQFFFFPSTPRGAKGGEKVGRVSTGKWLRLFYRQTLPVGRKFSLAAVLINVAEGKAVRECVGFAWAQSAVLQTMLGFVKECGGKGTLWQICVCLSGNMHIFLEEWLGLNHVLGVEN